MRNKSRKALCVALSASLLAGVVFMPNSVNTIVHAEETEMSTTGSTEVSGTKTDTDTNQVDVSNKEVLIGTEEGMQAGTNYTMKEEQALEFAVTMSLESENYGAFCVELADTNNSYLTAASDGNAWYAENAAGQMITGIASEFNSTIRAGYTYHVKILRTGQTFTITYYNPNGSAYVEYVAADTNFGEEINVHVMAQIGEFMVVQSYVDRDKTYKISGEDIVTLDSEGIPNEKLYNALLAASDMDSNGILSKQEAAGVEYLYLNGCKEGERIDLTNLARYAPDIQNMHFDAYNSDDNEEKKVLGKDVLQELIKLKNLKWLRVSGIQLEDIWLISQLSSLEGLELCNMELTTTEFIDKEKFPHLSTLNLSGNCILKVSDSIAEMTDLTSLDMSYSEIRELPDLTGLDKLEYLYLYGNMLQMKELTTNLPAKFVEDSEWISQNYNEYYDPSTDEYYPENQEIIQNDETGIVDKGLYAKLLYEGDENIGNKDGKLTVAEARRINYLYFYYDNDIYDYSNLAKYVPNLYHLHVSTRTWSTEKGTNSKESFLAEYKQLEKLTGLEIFNTYDSCIDTAFIEKISEKTQLQYLYLDLYNQKDKIDIAALKNLNQLMSLILYGSDFLNVQETINEISSLTSLALYYCDDFDFSKMNMDIKKQLNSFSLSYNNEVTTGVFDLTGCDKLGSLTLDGSYTDITGLENMSNLYSLTLRRYASEEEDVFLVDYLKKFPTSLNYLDLVGISVVDIKENTNILELTDLYYLSIQNADLNGFTGLDSMINLSYLELSGNQMEDISGVEKLINLYDLNLSGNQLKDISGVEKLINLHYLYLNNNELENLPNLSELTALTESRDSENKIINNLNLQGNKLTKEAIAGNVPDEFYKDSQWLARATMGRTSNGILYYRDLTDELMLSEMSYEDKNYYYSYYVAENVAIECIPEFFEFVKEQQHTVYIYFINTESGETTYSVSIEGDSLPETVEETITFPNATVLDKQEVIEDKYKELFGEEEKDIFYYENKGKYQIQGVIDIIYSDKFWTLEYDSNGNDFYNGKWVDIYFYDYSAEKSIMISENIYVGRWSGIGSNMDTAHEEYWNKSKEEGFYYIVSQKYAIDEEPDIEEPTTEGPDTEEPDTDEPTTEESTTGEPDTEKATIEGSATEEVSTGEPTIEEPDTEVPAITEPGTESKTEPSTAAEQETAAITGEAAQIIPDSKIVKKEEARGAILSTMSETIRPVVETIVDSAMTLTTDVFEAMKEENKKVTVGVVNESNELQYSWTFDYQSVDENKITDVDLTITFETDKKKEIENLTGQKDAFYMSFAYHGELPGPATIKTYVGNEYKDGEIVYLYYYNEDTNSIESVNKGKGLAVQNGYVTYTITHCSIYFLSAAAPDIYGITVEPENKDNIGQAPENTKQPETGDYTHIRFYLILCIASLTTIAVVYSKKRRKSL